MQYARLPSSTGDSIAEILIFTDQVLVELLGDSETLQYLLSRNPEAPFTIKVMLLPVIRAHRGPQQK